MPIYYFIVVISLFYLFLWINHIFIHTEKKWYKILVNSIKYILLVPFWLLVLIISVNLFLPLGLSNGYENDMVYIKNADKEASELLFIGKANKLGQWFVIHPIKESKLKTVFELENTALIDSINIGFPYDSIAEIGRASCRERV